MRSADAGGGGAVAGVGDSGEEELACPALTHPRGERGVFLVRGTCADNCGSALPPAGHGVHLPDAFVRRRRLLPTLAFRICNPLERGGTRRRTRSGDD